MELPAALVEQHWEERGFSDEEWQTFMKVHRCLHNKVSKKDPLMKQLKKSRSKVKEAFKERSKMVLAGTGIRLVRRLQVHEQFDKCEEIKQIVASIEPPAAEDTSTTSAAAEADNSTPDPAAADHKQHKQYSCPVCPLQFAQKRQAIDHERTHATQARNTVRSQSEKDKRQHGTASQGHSVDTEAVPEAASGDMGGASTTVRVGNLPRQINQKEIKKHFSCLKGAGNQGKVTRVRMIDDPVSRLCTARHLCTAR